MKAGDYVDILSKNYFDRFLPEGGSSFKVIISGKEKVTEFCESVTDRAAKDGAIVLNLCASEHKFHLMDRFYFGVAQAIRWNEEAFKFVVKHVSSGEGSAKSNSVDLDDWSRRSRRQVDALKTQISAAVKQNISQNYGYCAEFRIALTHLCLARFVSHGSPMSMYGAAIEEWLRGELNSVTALKPALIFRKIQRGMGRHMLYSTLRFLRKCGYRYTVLILDTSRYFENVKMSERGEGCYYTAAATMDLFESLRQSIDDVQQFEGALMIVVAPGAMLNDPKRGLDRYQALKMRLWSDFRLGNVQNPMAPMIRL